jgi:ubiquinone/menaquinone biosynthesis C-methylase UbiE
LFDDDKRFSHVIQHIHLLRCPVTGERLYLDSDRLVSEDGKHQYRLSESGIPLFAESELSREGKIQQDHYDRIANQYIENLGYPHTQEYSGYLDRALLKVIAEAQLGTIADICCGNGEAFRLLKDRFGVGVGVDISMGMLEVGQQGFPHPNILFLQGDATSLPLVTESFDSVLMLGAIHHVNDRAKLFSELFRVLKPGGTLIWREPADDFFLWRWLRMIIYRISPTLDASTEHPLMHHDTISQLEEAGFQPRVWRTYGFIGFTLLMNSDVLVFNRLFRFVPGIRWLTRKIVAFDDWIVHLPFMKFSGLQVIGMAQRPGV